MRSFDKYRNTRFIQKTDVEKGALVTIDKVTEENVAPEYQAEEIKYVIHFKENYKPWAPGIESLEDISHIAGTGDVDRWGGTEIVLFVDPDVKFGPKKVGGIRCRAPKIPKNRIPQNVQPPTQPSGPNPDYVGDNPPPPTDDDIPF
jgi:hypothetical protein